MSEKHYVIIGNGASANRAADVIRQGDNQGRITLISDEFFPFYYRHLLCKYLSGEEEESALIVRPPAYYKEMNIRLRLGQRVVKADLAAQTLYLDHMEKIHYTSLLLCSGGKPKIPEIFYSCRECFTVLKTLADVRRLRARLPEIEHVLIVGGDIVSVRFAAALRKKDIRVSFMVDEKSFWPLELSVDKKQEFCSVIAAKGCDIINDNTLRHIEINGRGYQVETSSGMTLKADVVGAFFGMTPDIDYLFGSGLDMERGILVDDHLKTNVENVYAAGDCAQVYNPQIRNYWVSIGWSNAEKLGEVAARNILGDSLAIDQPRTSILNYEGITVATEWWKEF